MNNYKSILEQADGIKDEIISIRRRLHSNPELGFEEIETTRYIADYLRGFGLEVSTGVGRTGIVAVLKGGVPGNVVALRADIDALPIQEENESEYTSKTEGKMHACGHDGHTAILLGAVRLLSENRRILKGTVKFIFQPAEEYSSGARAMLAEGVLDDPRVDLALALHILPDVKSGYIEVKSGAIMSSMDDFEINITGKGGHGSNPQNTIDPVITGAQLVTSLQTIVSRKISPIQPAVVSVCQFISGTKSNIIPSAAYLSGTIRCQDESVRRFIHEQMDIITKGICSAAGAEYQLKINELVPVTMNDTNVYHDFVNCTSEILGSDKIILMDKTRTYSEDFSLFGEMVPSIMFFLGTYNEQKDCVYPPHNPKFKIDEDILPLGSAIFANYCLKRTIQ